MPPPLSPVNDFKKRKLLAGLAYSQNPPGIWFLNPQQWVTHHMFKRASVWDIPLVKPRFGCSTNLALAASGYDVAHELNRYDRGVKARESYDWFRWHKPLQAYFVCMYGTDLPAC